jgi:hypothetical protein
MPGSPKEGPMGKAKASAEDKLKAQLLDGLRKGLDGSTRRLQGAGKNPGLFPGGKTGEAVVRRALDGGLVRQVPSPQPAKPGGRSKPPVFAVVTDKGRLLVLDSDSPAALLSGLGESLSAQGVALSAAVQAAGGEVSALRESLDQLHKGLNAQLAAYQQTAQAVQAALERARQQSPAHSASARQEPHADAWLEDVVQMVAEQKRRNSFERATLPRIYEQLRKSRPSLTLGQFHDGLRALQAQRRIRLAPYTQALATLEDAQNALYFDREVKFYVDLP